MTIGFPGCGKSTAAKEQNELYGTIIVSSDAIRKEVFGDEDNQDHNTEVFEIMAKRTIENLKAGNDVIYDATNLSRKYRTNFLKSVPINSDRIAVVFATPFDICLERNNSRDRVVPENVLWKMYKSFQMPYYTEGFDEIRIISNTDTDHYRRLLAEPRIAQYDIEHDNIHHTGTIGKHTDNVLINGIIIADREKLDVYESKLLTTACLFHDIGKEKTKTFTNFKGETTTDAHYYGHDSVSAYDFMCGMINHNMFDTADIIFIANLINLHMVFYGGVDAINAMKNRFDDRLWRLLEFLHEADKNGG